MLGRSCTRSTSPVASSSRRGDPVSEAAVSPWLTIVTVVKDDAAGFERTMNSIAQQDLNGVEWLIIDSSTDSIALPALLASEVAPTNHYAWTEPHGIYPAMNAGLARATGTYVYFLNAGDSFAGPNAVGTIRGAVVAEPKWLYGQVRFVDEAGNAVTPTPFDYAVEKKHAFSRGRFPPHQGTIVRTDVLRRVGGFDESFRIAADYNAMLSLSRVGAPIEMANVLAEFVTGGASSQQWRRSVREFHRARQATFALAGADRLWETLRTAKQWLLLWSHNKLAGATSKSKDGR